MDYSLKRIIQLTLVLKVSLLALIFLGFHFLPFDHQAFQNSFHYPADSAAGWTSAYKTWDAQYYLYLAQKGYAPYQASNAFYPLFPLLIRSVHSLFLNHYLFAGLYLSHFFTLLSVIYLYLLVEKSHDAKTAFYSCVFLLAFPTGFYIGLVYGESLFLALTTAFFYYSREGKMGRAAICAFLAPWSRPVGIFLIAPALVDSWTQETFKGKSFLNKLLLPAAVLFGFVFYLGFMNWFAGDYWAGFNAEKFFPFHRSVMTIFHPIHWINNNFIQYPYSWTRDTTSMLDKIFFAVFLIALAFAYRYLDKSFFIYALITGLIPALTGDLFSFKRFAAVLFPLFIFAAIKLKDKAEYYLFPSLPLQGLLVVAHALNYWVA